MLYTVDGLVLRVQNHGENDRLITILTANGKINALCHGARSLKSKMANLTQPFVYGNFEINKRSGALPWVRGGSTNEVFYGLREGVEKMFLATYICDVASELSGEGVDCFEILRLTLNTLYAIMTDMRPISQIKAAFELRAAAISGYRPDVLRCEDCGAENTENTYFDVMNGAIVCSACLEKRGAGLGKKYSSVYDDVRERSVLVPLNPASLSAIRFVLYSPQEKIYSFSLALDEDLRMFARAGEEYLLNHLGHGFDSLDLYYSMI